MILTAKYYSLAQCNEGLNLGSVIIPTHANATNSGNFFSVPALQESANCFDSLNLDYRQEYIIWEEVVTQIDSGVPQFSNHFDWDNLLSTWAGDPDLHIIYEPTKTDVVNTLHPAPLGFTSHISALDPYFFSDTAFINQNYWKTISQNIFKFNEYISIKSKEDFLKSISTINSPIVIDRLPVNKKTNWMRKLLRKKEQRLIMI